METPVPSTGGPSDGPSIPLLILLVLGIGAGLYILAPLVSVIAVIVGAVAPLAPFIVVILIIAWLFK